VGARAAAFAASPISLALAIPIRTLASGAHRRILLTPAGHPFVPASLATESSQHHTSHAWVLEYIPNSNWIQEWCDRCIRAVPEKLAGCATTRRLA